MRKYDTSLFKSCLPHIGWHLSVSSVCLQNSWFLIFNSIIVIHCVKEDTLFIHSSGEGHLCCYKFLVIKNSAAMNISEQVSLLDGRGYFGYMPRHGLTGCSDRTTHNWETMLYFFQV